MNTNENNFNDDQNAPFDKNGKASFGLPSNYFDSFESKLRQKLELESELQEYALLSSIKKTNTFSLPNDYFSSLEAKLEFQTELVEFPILQSIQPNLSFPIDSEYIESFKNKLVSKIEFTEELSEFVILNSIIKQNLYICPNNYFENLSNEIKENIHKPSISVFGNLFHFIFNKKLALSFSVIIIALLSWLLYPKNITETINDSNCKTLACLEKQEILNNTKAISSFDEDQLIELVNLKKLDNQLNNTKKENTKKTEADSFINDSNLDEIIDEL